MKNSLHVYKMVNIILRMNQIISRICVLSCNWMKLTLILNTQGPSFEANEQFFFSLFLVSYTILGLLTACNQYCRLSCPNASYIVVFLLPTRTHAHTLSLFLSIHMYRVPVRLCSCTITYESNIKLHNKYHF